MSTLRLKLAGGVLGVQNADRVSGLPEFLSSLSLPVGRADDPDRYLTIRADESALRCYFDGDEEPYYEARGRDDFLLLFERTLINLFLDFLPRSTLVFHGAGFYRAGRLVGFLGEPDAGKSTLASEFMFEGWTFVSDELLVLDETGRCLYPFPKPLNLDPDRTYPDLDTLRLRGSGGSVFAYGLPPESAIDNTVLSVQSCRFYQLNRVETTQQPGVVELEGGRSFLSLLGQLLKPEESRRKFHRLSTFHGDELTHRRLTYSEVETLRGRDLLHDQSGG